MARIVRTRRWTPNILPAVNKMKSVVLGLVAVRLLQVCPVNTPKLPLSTVSGINVKIRPNSEKTRVGIIIIFQAIFTKREFKFTSPPST
ncbi:hypothetical protein ACFLRN_08870 [Thermoproteota archaeon]